MNNSTIYDMFSEYIVGVVMKLDREDRKVGVYIPKLMPGVYGDTMHEETVPTYDGDIDEHITGNISDTVTTVNYIWCRSLDYHAALPEIGSKVFIGFIDYSPTMPYWMPFNYNNDYSVIPEERYAKLYKLGIGNSEANVFADVREDDQILIKFPSGIKVTKDNVDDKRIILNVDEDYKLLNNMQLGDAVRSLQETEAFLLDYIRNSYIDKIKAIKLSDMSEIYQYYGKLDAYERCTEFLGEITELISDNLFKLHTLSDIRTVGDYYKECVDLLSSGYENFKNYCRIFLSLPEDVREDIEESRSIMANLTVLPKSNNGKSTSFIEDEPVSLASVKELLVMKSEYTKNIFRDIRDRLMTFPLLSELKERVSALDSSDMALVYSFYGDDGTERHVSSKVRLFEEISKTTKNKDKIQVYENNEYITYNALSIPVAADYYTYTHLGWVTDAAGAYKVTKSISGNKVITSYKAQNIFSNDDEYKYWVAENATLTPLSLICTANTCDKIDYRKIKLSDTETLRKSDIQIKTYDEDDEVALYNKYIKIINSYCDDLGGIFKAKEDVVLSDTSLQLDIYDSLKTGDDSDKTAYEFTPISDTKYNYYSKDIKVFSGSNTYTMSLGTLNTILLFHDVIPCYSYAYDEETKSYVKATIVDEDDSAVMDKLVGYTPLTIYYKNVEVMRIMIDNL